MFIVLEGVDGSGKSTLAKMLAEELNIEHYSTPPGEFLEKREEIDLSASPDDHYHFYLSGIIQASSEISKMLESGRGAVVDRYWISTLVYHLVMGAKVNKEDFRGIILPDVTILLSVDPCIQAKRLATRGMSAGDRRMLNQQQELAQQFESILKSLAQPFLTVDTSHMTPSEVIAKIVAKLVPY